jgi:hypothetical protein
MIQQNQDDPRRAPDSDVRESDGADGVRVRPWPGEWIISDGGRSISVNFSRPVYITLSFSSSSASRVSRQELLDRPGLIQFFA